MFTILARFLNRLLSPAGLELRRRRHEPDVYHRRGATLLRFAAERGVDVLLDVGANQGQYAAAFHEAGFRGRIISFEPLAETYAVLQPRAARHPHWESHQVALGDTDSTALIRVGGNRECSSLFPMSAGLVQAYPASASCGEQPVQVRRLDAMRSQLFKETDRIFLKLDIQGYELKALRGALDTLRQVQLLDIELSLVPLYDGQPLVIEMLQFLRDQGFIPVSLENGFSDPGRGHALQVDAIFLRQEPGPAHRAP